VAIKDIPGYIIYGPLRIAIKQEKSLIKREDSLGRSYRDYEEILVDADVSTGRQKETLWYLLVDMIQTHMAVSWDEDKQESFSRLLYAVIQDNPAVVTGGVAELESIRMFGVNFSIVPMEDTSSDNAMLDRTKRQVFIHASLPERQQKVAVWHEIVHQVLYVLGIEEDEDEINRVDFVLGTLFSQNDMAWILDGDGDECHVREEADRAAEGESASVDEGGGNNAKS
jgi:hypothetical protein